MYAIPGNWITVDQRQEFVQAVNETKIWQLITDKHFYYSIAQLKHSA